MIFDPRHSFGANDAAQAIVGGPRRARTAVKIACPKSLMSKAGRQHGHIPRGSQGGVPMRSGVYQDGPTDDKNVQRGGTAMYD